MSEITDKTTGLQSENLYNQISQILKEARSKVAVTVNTAMVQAYWHIGKLIVDAQGGEAKAKYGNGLIDEISRRLTVEFGRGFKRSNLRDMRKFYQTFPIYQTLSGKLSWSHYLTLIRVSNPKAREYYVEEAAKGGWSVRQLERQIETQYYERLLASHRDEAEVKEIMAKNRPVNPEKFDPLRLVHDPFVLEFLDMKEDPALQEKELESAILTHIEDFLLELGRGFAFVGRQKRFTLEGDHFYPDLVFYNIPARCYVIIDLKMAKAGYADVGQMQLYVNYFNREVCTADDNPTVGIILCAEKNDTVIEYTLGNRNDIGVFASKYKLILPTEEELKREIEQTKENFKRLKG
ncbi:MAG: PDDEXK nuclease domain-containing protein [Duncaniella sp.]|uniref:PDDEXK nuclease domain-containing protein n=1 Tax=Duncaniella sp. TaxID=2518496 RepID=UPI0023D01859|nr:PDDEXK nuclease domain-containing protein [Duncaniella sp.]MDE6090061.1 PDDEXK nuclease domain-containing protein [Duncaniella sp.]